HDLLGPTDAAVIWRESREELRTRLLNPYLDLVIDARYREVVLVTDPSELAVAARTAQLIRVVPLAPLVARLRASFRRLVGPDLEQTPHRSRRRTSETG